MSPNVTIPNSVASIGDWAFYECTSLRSVTIPNSVTSIGDCAFYNCFSLTSVAIPNSVTSIGVWEFAGCGSLTSVTIPNSVTSIGEYGFGSCTHLTNVTIPNSVTSFGDFAFSQCTRLRSVIFEGNAPVINSDSFSGAPASLIVYYLPNTKGWGATFAGYRTVMLSNSIDVVNPFDSGVMLEGASAGLFSWISGRPAPDYQWYFNGQPVIGATNDTLVISPASALNAGAYRVIASNVFGTVTNGPATWGVNNVTTSNYFALSIADATGGPMQIQSSPNISGPWTHLANLTPTNNPQTYIDFSAANIGQRYYRTTQPARLESWIFRGWSFTAPAGSVQKIEYVDGQTGYNNWQLLTNVTLPSSPYLYIDMTETNNWPRYYRTTDLP